MNTFARIIVRFPWNVILALYVALSVFAAVAWEIFLATWDVLVVGKVRKF